jgi:hypothetical protein
MENRKRTGGYRFSHTRITADTLYRFYQTRKKPPEVFMRLILQTILQMV